MNQTRLKELLHYCPHAGVFTWKKDYPRARRGVNAGAKDAYGYVVIRLDGVLYKAHRLAWLFMTGVWPTKNVDHINRVRDDNRWPNLRDVGQSENMLNISVRSTSKSGVTGVVWDAARSKWKAQIRINYKNIGLGRFKHLDDAVRARKSAEQKFRFNVRA